MAGGKQYPRRNSTHRAITWVINMVINEVKEPIGNQELNPPTAAAHEEGKFRRWVIPSIVVLVVAGVLISGIRSRIKASSTLRAVTAQMAVPSVSVVVPKRSAPAEEIILPGNIQPFISSPIYARTDGYLKKWYFDIGTRVKAGELLAVIQTPEVDQQLAQARSTLATAQANLELAQITKDRYEGLLTKHSAPYHKQRHSRHSV